MACSTGDRDLPADGISFSRRRQRRGFTLAELVAALVALMIFVSLASAVDRYVREDALRRQAIATLRTAMDALEAYRMCPRGEPHSQAAVAQSAAAQPVATQSATTQVAAGGYPPSSDDGRSLLAALRSCRACDEPLARLSERALRDAAVAITDPYGQPLRYLSDGGIGGRPVLISAGPDRIFDTPDDIRSDQN
jgi:type II secretory pathway pseudopilin PulG